MPVCAFTACAKSDSVNRLASKSRRAMRPVKATGWKLMRDPALQRKRLRPSLQFHERGFPAPGVAHHLPRVAGRLRGMDDDARLGPAPQRLLVFIYPTPVIGER